MRRQLRRSRRPQRQLGKLTCPHYEIELTTHRVRGRIAALDFEARIPGVSGRDGLIGMLMTEIDDNRYSVASIGVDTEYRRCGVGTRLYTAAAKMGCAMGLKLGSDNLRSTYSDGFWQKQVRKGRAACVEQAPEHSGSLHSEMGPRLNRGGCARYELLSCPVTDLSGARRRRRRRR